MVFPLLIVGGLIVSAGAATGFALAGNQVGKGIGESSSMIVIILAIAAVALFIFKKRGMI